jgi:Mrp family chromosome partitioning ATPase
VDAQASPGVTSAGRALDVLAAGEVQPPNPGELLESQTMSAVLEQAQSTYDLVVIDTAPLAVVSDAFSLLTKVDGVIIVGRAGHSRRDAAELLHQTLSSSHARVLGIVANGVKTSNPGSRTYATRGTPGGAGTPPSVVASSNGLAPDEESMPMVRS